MSGLGEVDNHLFVELNHIDRLKTPSLIVIKQENLH